MNFEIKLMWILALISMCRSDQSVPFHHISIILLDFPLLVIFSGTYAAKRGKEGENFGYVDILYFI